MRIDLHSHSTVSDGTQSPTQVVHAAAEAGLDVLSLTDHDSTAGWDEAAAAAVEVGIDFVPGIEVSTTFRGRSVHLLAYWPDPDHPELAAALAENRDARRARVPGMLSELAEHGIDLTVEDVAGAAPHTTAPGRPHLADALIAAGVASGRGEAMSRYLQFGSSGTGPRVGVDLLEALAVVLAAGGAPVLAHPWGRGSRAALDHAVVADLTERGLVGIEVDHEDHSPATRRELRELAATLDLVVTGSSDHHGSGKRGHALGCHTTAPDQYHRLRDAAQRLS